MSKLQEIKQLLQVAMANGTGHVDLTTYSLSWLIEQLEQAQKESNEQYHHNLQLSHALDVDSNREQIKFMSEEIEELRKQLEQAQAEKKQYENMAMDYVRHQLTLKSELENCCIDIAKLKAANQKLVECLDRTEDFVQYISSLRGQDLQVANWHLNGDLEPLDNFLEENGIDEVLSDLDKHIRGSEVKGNG